MARARSTDKDKTVKRRVDVAKAFAATDDPVPVLLVPRAEVPWGELGDLATKLLLRVDGATSATVIATGAGTIATPRECALELAALAKRGIVRLEPSACATAEEKPDEEGLDLDLEIDLSRL